MAFDFPANPSIGQPYVVSGITYIFDGVAWNVSAAPNTAVLTAQTLNRIVNPAMQHSQEIGAAMVTTNGAYIIDQWVAQVSGIAFNAQKTNATIRQIGMTVTTGKAIAAGDYLSYSQVIEGVNVGDFYYGSSLALPSVLRFEVYCTVAGTFGISLSELYH